MRDRAPVEWLLDAAVGQHALGHPDATGARHQRLGSSGLEVVELGTRLAADLEKILETPGGEQDDARAAPFEQRVRRHGRTVVQARCGPGDQLAEPLGHRTCRVGGRRAHLQHEQAPPDEGDEIGERAAGVRADDDRGPRQASADAALASAFFLAVPLPSLVLEALALAPPASLFDSPLEELSPDFSPDFWPCWPARP